MINFPRHFSFLADNPKYVLESRGGIEVKGKGLMTTYWLRGMADGSVWNNEYDGNDLMETSTFEYYKKHGLPTVLNGVDSHKKTNSVSKVHNKKSSICVVS